METFDLFSLIIIPFSLFFFIFDFLRDGEILTDELKIGILQYIHHLLFTLNVSGLICTVLFSTNIFTVILLILLSTGIQIGWLINNDYCWLTTLTNRLIGTKCKNRKWMADIESHIKHYLYGDSWSITDINKLNNKWFVCLFNLFNLITIISYIISQYTK